MPNQSEEIIGGQSNVGGGQTVYTSGGGAITTSGSQSPRFRASDIRRSRGRGGGSSNQTPAPVQYQSELLGQTFASLEAKEQAESSFRQQQQQNALTQAKSEQDRQQQRSSITARGSQIVQVGQDTPEAYREAGITSSVSKAQGVPFRQTVKELITNPSQIIPTVQSVVSTRVTNPLSQKIGQVAQKFSSAQTGTERTFQTKTQQEIKTFENQVNNYSSQVEGYNKDVAGFESKYSNRQLSDAEFVQATKERMNLNRQGAILTQQQEILTAKEEAIKQKVENYQSDLSKARKSAPLVERLSVSATKGVGDVISSAAFVTKFVGSPSKTQQELAETAPQAIKEFGSSIRLDPLGTGVQLGAGLVAGNFIGKIVSKGASVTKKILKSSTAETTLSVSVGNVKAVKVPGQPNMYRVSGEGIGEVKNLKGEVLGKVTTKTDSITISARTPEEATKTYTQGVASSFAQVGADTSRIRVGINSIEGTAEFNSGVVEGLSKGKGTYRIDSIMEGITKPQFKKVPSNVNVVGLRVEEVLPFGKKIKMQVGSKLKLKQQVTPPSLAISKSIEKALIETPKVRTSLVDTKTLVSDSVGLELIPLGFKRPKIKKQSAGFERDVVDLLKQDIDFGYPGITFEGTPTSSKGFGRGNKALQQSVQALDLDIKVVEQTGIQSTRAVSTKATKQLQKDIKIQQLKQDIFGKSKGSNKLAQVVRQESKEIEKAVTKQVSLGSQIKIKQKALFDELNFESLGLNLGQIQGQGLKQSQRQRSALKSAQASASLGFAGAGVPNIPHPKGFGFIPFKFGSDKPGAGSQDFKQLEKKQRKKVPAYAASLAAAAFQVSPVKVTRKQYEQLKRKVYSGIEARPVLQIVDDNLNKSIKQSVQF